MIYLFSRLERRRISITHGESKWNKIILNVGQDVVALTLIIVLVPKDKSGKEHKNTLNIKVRQKLCNIYLLASSASHDRSS